MEVPLESSTTCLEAERSKDFRKLRQLALLPPHPSTTSNRNYSEGKAGVEPENIAPIVPAAPNPHESYVQHLGAGAWGGRGKRLLEFPGGEPGGGRRRARKRGFTRSPQPVPRPPGPRSARRPEALPLRVLLPGLPLLGRRAQTERLPAHLPSSGVRARGPALRWVSARKPVPSRRRVRSRGRAPRSGVREAASPWKGALLGGIFQPGGPTSRPSTWRRTARSEGPGHAAPPGPGAARGSAPGLPALVRARGTAEGLLPLPVSLRARSRSYLSWRCTHRTTQLRSHPSASLPRVPETGRAEGRRKAPASRGARGSERPNLLAGGGGGGSAAPGAALGDRAQEGGPGRPAPRPPPHGGRRRCGAPTGPRCGCARLGAGSATPAGCPPRGDRAVLLRPLSCSREPGRRSPRTCGPGGGGRRLAPSVSQAPPRRAGLAAVAASVSALRWGLPKLPQIIPAEKNRGALARGLFSGQNPDGAGATERAQRLPGNN